MAKKVLIAEDEKPMAKALETKLTKAGYEVTVVFNGEEAIEALKKTKFHAVLLDLMMPKVDGFSVLEWKKTNKNTAPVIVSTNLSSETDRKKVTELGAKDFIVKSDTPITEILNHIKNVLS